MLLLLILLHGLMLLLMLMRLTSVYTGFPAKQKRFLREPAEASDGNSLKHNFLNGFSFFDHKGLLALSDQPKLKIRWVRAGPDMTRASLGPQVTKPQVIFFLLGFSLPSPLPLTKCKAQIWMLSLESF